MLSVVQQERQSNNLLLQFTVICPFGWLCTIKLIEVLWLDPDRNKESVCSPPSWDPYRRYGSEMNQLSAAGKNLQPAASKEVKEEYRKSGHMTT